MKNKLSILLFHFINLIRSVLHPFVNFFLQYLIPGIRQRLKFERKNQNDKLARSFKSDQLEANIAFEVSSEGELEQIAPIVEMLASQGCLLELIFASESVEKKCEDLARRWGSDSLRIFRLPLLDFSLFRASRKSREWGLKNWLTAPKLVLVRYDFYPELLLAGANRKFILVSATLKGKEKVFNSSILDIPGRLKKFYYQMIFLLFDNIVVTSSIDRELFIGKAGYPSGQLRELDFRVLQISKRAGEFISTLASHPFHPYFSRLLDNFREGEHGQSSRLIMGSAWPNELSIFDSFQFLKEIAAGKVLVAIAPHKLDRESLDEMGASFEKICLEHKMRIPFYHLSSSLSSKEELEYFFEKMSLEPGVLMISVRGILCELYSYFGHVFVGGGHGRSIHSVLEPYLSMARIYCGPKVFRSTEYDFIKNYSPQFIHIVEKLSEFYDIFKARVDDPIDRKRRMELTAGIEGEFTRVMRLFTEEANDQ